MLGLPGENDADEKKEQGAHLAAFKSREFVQGEKENLLREGERTRLKGELDPREFVQMEN